MTGSTAKPGIKGSITQEQALAEKADLIVKSVDATSIQFEQMAPAPENYRMPIGTSMVFEVDEPVNPWPTGTDFDWIADLSSEVAAHLLSATRVHVSVAKHALLAAKHSAAHPEGLNPNHEALQRDVYNSELSVARSQDLVHRLEGILS